MTSIIRSLTMSGFAGKARVHQLEYQYYPEVIERLVLCLE